MKSFKGFRYAVYSEGDSGEDNRIFLCKTKKKAWALADKLTLKYARDYYYKNKISEQELFDYCHDNFTIVFIPFSIESLYEHLEHNNIDTKSILDQAKQRRRRWQNFSS